MMRQAQLCLSVVLGSFVQLFGPLRSLLCLPWELPRGVFGVAGLYY